MYPEVWCGGVGNLESGPHALMVTGTHLATARVAPPLCEHGAVAAGENRAHWQVQGHYHQSSSHGGACTGGPLNRESLNALEQDTQGSSTGKWTPTVTFATTWDPPNGGQWYRTAQSGSTSTIFPGQQENKQHLQTRNNRRRPRAITNDG